LIAALSARAPSALAQTSASDKAAAEALFDQGVQLMKQSSFAEACGKLEQSQRFDPAVGTLLYLGECYERIGRTASAWATFREAASLAGNEGQAERARVASNRARELEPKLSRLAVEVSAELSKLPGITVRRGSARLEPSLFGVPLPVDPGEIRIEVTAPGYETFSTVTTVPAAGGSASVRVPMLVKGADPEPAPSPSVAPREPVATAAATSREFTVAPAEPSGLSGQQTLGLVVGGVGLVGVGVGSFFGVRAITKNGDALEHCDEQGLCENQTGLDLTKEAKDAAGIANIALGAGAALLITGTALYLTGNPQQQRALRITPILTTNAAGAQLGGRF
jgi:serine/threonine-protein kinase